MDPGQPARDTDFLFAYVASVAQNFNASLNRGEEPGGIDWVEIGAGGETVAIGALDDEQLNRTVAAARRTGELTQMAGGARGDTVRKLRQGPATAQMTVLDLQPARRAARMREQEVDATGLAQPHFAAVDRVSAKLGDGVGGQGLGDKGVGQQGVDANEAAVGLEELKRPGEFSLGPGGGRDPRAHSRLVQPEHSAWIGAVRGHYPPIVQRDVREEAFVAADQASMRQRLRQKHARPMPVFRHQGPSKEAAMAISERVTASALIIGDEILSGRTQDTNLGDIARYLAAFGVDLAEARVVADDKAEIIAALNALRERYDYVITTGGIGPTHDDITAACVAEAFGAPLEEHPEIIALLAARWGDQINAARRRMARVPRGGTLVKNPVQGPPGFQIGNVFVLAGVPQIMRGMLEDVGPRLRTGRVVISRTVRVEGTGEGAIAAPLEALAKAHPSLSLGSYPFYGPEGYGSNLVIRGRDADEVASTVEELVEALKDVGAKSVAPVEA